MDRTSYRDLFSGKYYIGSLTLTAFFKIARDEDGMEARLVPKIMGDFAIAQMPKCARSSASVRPPFPIS